MLGPEPGRNAKSDSLSASISASDYQDRLLHVGPDLLGYPDTSHDPAPVVTRSCLEYRYVQSESDRASVLKAALPAHSRSCKWGERGSPLT